MGDRQMNYVQHSSENCVARFPDWKTLSSYLKLEEEGDSEEADEMERLKERQREREEELRTTEEELRRSRY
jgi:hypothetical protein